MTNLKPETLNPKPQIRLIASDLDGTLHSTGTFSPRVRDAVARARAQGVRVVVATGRMFLSAGRLARDLGLDDVVVTDHGATIWDLQTNTILTQQCVPTDLARAACALMPPDGTVLVCVNEKFHTPRITENALAFANYNRYNLVHTPDLIETLDAAPQKMVFIHDEDVTRDLLARMTRALGEQLQVVQSHPYFVEVTHRETSKGNAIAWLANRWGIARDQVLAMGDQGNDRSMIEWAGVGVAMGNATDELKRVADFVAPSVDEDGAAVAIEKFVLARDE